MPIPEAVIGGAVGLVGGLIKIIGKKKPHALWYQNVLPSATLPHGVWMKKAGPMSARQCRKTMNALIKAGGYEAARFMIIRADVNPNN